MSDVKEVAEAVQVILQPLADKLGTTPQHVLELQIKQAYVDGYISVFWSLVGLFIVVRFYIVMKKIKKEKIEIKEGTEEYYKIGAYGVYLVIGALIFLYNFSTTLKCFINPEYYALQHLIQLVK